MVAKLKKRRTAARRGSESIVAQCNAPTLEKGLAILELLCAQAKGLRLREIAKMLGRTVDEIFRMLAVLEATGYVRRIPESDQYVLTLKLFQQSHMFPPIKRLINASIAPMERLSEVTGQSCHLVERSDGKGLVIAGHDSRGPQTLSVRVGTLINLLDTCSGHLILAFADEQDRAKMIAAQPVTLRKRFADTAISGMAERILKQRHECCPSQRINGVFDIGFPIFDSRCEMIAALSMPFLEQINEAQTVDLESAKKYLSVSAREISSLMGFPEN
jgi:DNA-binding IclR family transcriptional regulator